MGRIKTYCEKCRKKTTHNIRVVDGKGVFVCRQCEILVEQFNENHPERQENVEGLRPFIGSNQPCQVIDMVRNYIQTQKMF